MWKIFYIESVDHAKVLNSIDTWSARVFNFYEIKLKHYFAQKVAMHFDNMMIFQQKRGLHQNLFESLSLAEKEMQNVSGVFPSITSYWIRDQDGSYLITFGLKEKELFPEIEGFKILKDNTMPMEGKNEKLRNMSFSNLVFDAELVNYSQNWINFTPSLEERSVIQTEFILFNMYFRKNPSSLLEKIQFEENIKTHPQYEELYGKVLKVMPKIENSLEQEWRTTTINYEDIQAKVRRSRKSV